MLNEWKRALEAIILSDSHNNLRQQDRYCSIFDFKKGLKVQSRKAVTCLRSYKVADLALDPLGFDSFSSLSTSHSSKVCLVELGARF